MNKKLISAAVLVGLAGSATAVNVNSDGLGQVLLYPYYTTNSGKFTNVQVVNTTDQVKAVKVRFSEGVNTWEVLDFNLYLSPYDVWTGVLVQNDKGVPMLKSQDTSCTVPSIPKNGEALRDANIVKYKSRTAEVTELTSVERLTEGHIEVIEMGNVEDKTGEVVAKKNLAVSATHVDGVPADCASLKTAWKSGAWATNSVKGMTSPTGGLFGMAEIIDVAQGTDRGYDAVAIDGFFDTVNTDGIAHSVPGNSYPNLNGEMLTGRSMASRRKVGNLESIVYYKGEAKKSNWETTVDALSAALNVSTMANVYYIGDSLSAATDWVVSFPTKHFYVNENTATVTSGQNGFAKDCSAKKETCGTFADPFADGFGVEVAMSPYDREETTTSLDLDFSPSVRKTNELVNEVNVIEFSASRSVFDSKLANNIALGFEGGWAQLDFRNGEMKSKDGDIYKGLPAIGFASTKVVNGNVGGSLANYAVLYDHKYTRQIMSS